LTINPRSIIDLAPHLNDGIFSPRAYTGLVQAQSAEARRFRFGVFELDGAQGELRRSGILIKLAPQPLAVLELLAQNAGELVTREQIQQRLWGTQTFVDFDRNLNVCMAQIRAALGDDAESQRFIRTIPKRGYTLIQPVEAMGETPVRRAMPRWLWISLTLAALGTLAAIYLSRPAPGARIVLAVLPFEGDDAIAGAVTDETITDLGELGADRLAVIARTSVMRMKGADLPRVAASLRAGYAIEGAVRIENGRVRIAARLVKISDQTLAWTEAFEDATDHLFLLEQNVASRISAGVIRTLLHNIAPSAAPRTSDAAAYEAYRTGRMLVSEGALDRAAAQFEIATARDPRFASAWAALADTGVALARSTGAADPFVKAGAAARRAVDLDPSSAEAHNALANTLFWFE
jgi:DNA-binding winged helix-turn-helix (wHTH) protein/TolB-like protein